MSHPIIGCHTPSLLEHGQATSGRLTSMKLDYSQSANDKHPWRIEYTFELHEGGEAAGFCEAWDPSHAQRTPGDAVWIVYAPDQESAPGKDGPHIASAVWPPLH